MDRAKCCLINFYNCFRIMFRSGTFLRLGVHGSLYTVDDKFMVAVPNLYKSIYRWNN